eukprot:741796-Pyramimonas_sp.AAC.1
MPCLQCRGRPSRIAAAVRDHPRAHPLWCREYAMRAVPWTTVADSGCGGGPPTAHPLWCRKSAMPAVPLTTVTESGRGEKTPPAHPLDMNLTKASKRPGQ